MGIGFKTFFFLAFNFSDYTGWFALAIVLLTLILYLFDIDGWKKGVSAIFRHFFNFVTFLAIVVWSLFIAGETTQSPMALFCLLIPLWLIFIRKAYLPDKEFRLYISQLCGPLFLTGFIFIVAFLGWVFAKPRNRYNDVTRYFYAQEAGCEPQ